MNVHTLLLDIHSEYTYCCGESNFMEIIHVQRLPWEK